MRGDRAKLATGFCAVLWLGGLAFGVKQAATLTEPEPLLGLLILGYLAAWGAFSAATRMVHPARFLACTASIAITILVFEIPSWLGVVDYRGLFANPTPPWLRSENRIDPDLLFVRRGHQRIRRVFLGDDAYQLDATTRPTLYRSNVRYDRDGFRNSSDDRQAATVVVGDSFIEGIHVSDREVVTARLTEYLGHPVANLGRAGYGPQQELHVLRRYGIASQPRTCVWAFYEGNDLDDAARYEEDRELVRAVDRRSLSGALFDRSFTRNSLVYLIRSWLHPEPRRPARRHTGQFLARSGESVPIYFASGDYRAGLVNQDSSTSTRRLNRLRSVLSDARELCESQGICLLVVFIPTKWRVYHDLCAFEPDATCTRWPVDDLPDAVRELTRGLGHEIRFLDLTPRLRAEAASGSLVYLPDDTHWSATGHRVAASAIAEALDARRLATREP